MTEPQDPTPNPLIGANPVRVARPASLPAAEARLVVVEASAGTGKTFFLEHRVIDLILAGAELGQILLVTFTDKAVAELRLRIRDLLDRLSRTTVATGVATAVDGAPAWIVDDDARRRLRAAVTAFDHAPIYTIHGFCHRILIEDAFSARRLFDQTQVADEVAFDAAFGALLRERFAYRSPDRDLLAAFLETRTVSGAPRTVDALRALLLGCVRADARLRRPIDPEVIHATFERLVATFGNEATCAAVIASERRWAPAWIARIKEALAWCANDPTPPRQLAAIDQIRDVADKLASRAAKLPADVVAAVRAVASTSSLDEAIAAQMLPAVIARIGADKAEHGQFDYDDMLDLVWAALTGPHRDELAQRLRERAPWAMIDEFQDTDPVQWNIFRTVWMHPDARGLTIVGDPKQAIYGFRGADVETYVAARDEMMRADATRVVLDVNRRSTKPLVTALNQILVGTLGLPMLSGKITYDDPVRASGDVVCDDRRDRCRDRGVARRAAGVARARRGPAVCARSGDGADPREPRERRARGGAARARPAVRAGRAREAVQDPGGGRAGVCARRDRRAARSLRPPARAAHPVLRRALGRADAGGRRARSPPGDRADLRLGAARGAPRLRGAVPPAGRGQPVRRACAGARRRRARADQHVAPDRAPGRGRCTLAQRSPRAGRPAPPVDSRRHQPPRRA